MRYRVVAEWDPTGWWVVSVPEVPGAITQCRRLEQVRADATEVIELVTNEVVDPDLLDIEPTVAGEAGEVAARVRRIRAEHERLPDLTREAVDLLHRQGFSVRDIGILTGISYQRVGQLTAKQQKAS